ncbi:hypothetical protein A6B43_06095 [Vespertiliibacter pulmonis]|uniref:Transferrin binding protein n=1 Tax=Vespertiliibacter pulmonis TaxID=1443036 RepID=A0A3N4W2U7_9PAST|nr:Slam-dependent surface lipoprotein [Vespertiliibacter pulmonis]QLB21121.1 hypothetical protein A6B43_06095 [Vespertiliibacter pulmonis]RPE83777.1 transferrin binding protein [Vespertiliibacter pulmonis]
MMKPTKFCLTILAGFVITACNSGGSDDGKSAKARIETLKVETPKVETPKVEIPKVEAPKVETPKVETPKVEAPKVEAPKVEAPKVEAPKVEASKVEAPKVEAPKVEAPKVEAPKVESPKVEAPKVEAPKVEAPKAEMPKVETPKVEAPKVETPKVEAPKVEAPKVEAPKVEAPKVEAPKVEAPKVEAPKVEAPKVETPKVEAPKVEAPKVEESESLKIEDTSVTGGAYISNGVNYIKKELNNADNIHAIIIDGKTLLVSEENSNRLGNFISYGPQSNDSRVSSTLVKDEEGNHIYAYNGHPTKEMPVSGNAVYKGEFFARGPFEFQLNPDSRETMGSSEFNVDFTNKQLLGELKSIGGEVIPSINVNAKLEGNRFMGDVSSELFKENGRIEGQFYGKNAEEIGGIFTDDKTFIGVVGAKKETLEPNK